MKQNDIFSPIRVFSRSLIFAAGVLFAPVPLSAEAVDCEALAARASATQSIPANVLASIARVESGRSIKGKVRAWPWTLNQGGKGMYFDTKAEALQYLRKAIAGGVRNIDVGCMQINYRWHKQNFASLEQMIDPHANTRYGAQYLAELRNRLGSWDRAIANYHSSNPARGRSYLNKVNNIRAKQPDTQARISSHLISPNMVVASAVDTATPERPTSPIVPQTTGPLVDIQNSNHGIPELPKVRRAAGEPLADTYLTVSKKVNEKNINSGLKNRWDDVVKIRKYMNP